jgi:hypothetical protein
VLARETARARLLLMASKSVTSEKQMKEESEPRDDLAGLVKRGVEAQNEVGDDELADPSELFCPSWGCEDGVRRVSEKGRPRRESRELTIA